MHRTLKSAATSASRGLDLVMLIGSIAAGPHGHGWDAGSLIVAIIRIARIGRLIDVIAESVRRRRGLIAVRPRDACVR
jgi:hypothetical protein